MAQIDLIMPKMGESVAEATIIRWLKNEGDKIDTDESVLEIATDKVDSDVPSPISGILVKKLYKEDEVVKVGAVIAIIENEVGMGKNNEPPESRIPQTFSGNGQSEKPDAQSTQVNFQFLPVNLPEKALNENLSVSIPVSDSKEESDRTELAGLEFLSQLSPINLNGSKQSFSDNQANPDRFYSPLVKSIAQSEGISRDELDLLSGTGAEGRVTKNDLLYYLERRSSAAYVNPDHIASRQATNQNQAHSLLKADKIAADAKPDLAAAIMEVSAPATLNAGIPGKAEHAQKTAANYNFQEGDEIIEMDRMRRLISEHMVHSKQTSAHVTSFVEADVTNMVLWRDKVKDAFKTRENQPITFTPIFIEAVARALKEFPMVNVSVFDKQIIIHKHINIGMAAALPSGNLIVPVLKDADEKNLFGLTKQVNDLANRARMNKLLPDEVSGGTFTLTNVGSFGNIMGTPIINQPQVAILAVGAIKKKPAVITTEMGDVIAIRHLMYLSLSYDHRVVDGAMGGKFLRRIADHLEAFDSKREI